MRVTWTAEDIRARGFDPGTGARLVPRYAPQSGKSESNPAATKRCNPGGVGPNPPPVAKGNKYSAIRTEGPDPCGGMRMYASKHEAHQAAFLSGSKARGLIADWFAQIPIAYGERADGKPAKTIVDFMVVYEYRPDGKAVVEFLDAKGKNLEASKAKFAALRGRGMQVRLV